MIVMTHEEGNSINCEEIDIDGNEIIMNGHRAPMRKISQIVADTPTVIESIVLCYNKPESEQGLLAFVTVRSGEVTRESIEQRIERTLQSSMVPKIVIVSKIPRLINGKTDRQALFQQYEKGRTSSPRSNDGNFRNFLRWFLFSLDIILVIFTFTYFLIFILFI